jgi:hypothetical protein
MKTFILLVITFLVVTACDDSNTNNNSSTNKITATLNGNSFKADKFNVEVMVGPARKQLRIFGESGELGIELLLKFEPMDTIKPGTYTLTKYGDFKAVYYHTGIKDTATEGTIQLDKFENELKPITKGSYSFLVKQDNTVMYGVSNGVFDIVK